MLFAFLVAGWLLVVGLYGVVSSRNMIHLVLCLTVAQSSTYVLLIAIGFRRHAIPPIFPNAPLGTRAVDPMVQSLAVTDAVVSATLVALLLALVLQAHKRTGSLEPGSFSATEG